MLVFLLGVIPVRTGGESAVPEVIIPAEEEPSIREAGLLDEVAEVAEVVETTEVTEVIEDSTPPKPEPSSTYGIPHLGPLDEEQAANAAYIREHLGEQFVLIANCESQLRQFNEDGSTLVSRTRDVGVMQINLAAHSREAERLGIDVYTLEGNVAYASILAANRGTADWYMSRHCHGL